MLTNTSKYALRAMAWIAQGRGEPVSTGVLAERSLASAPYLAKILRQLARAGLVRSRRGVGGGWILARAPGQITLLEVLRVVQPIERIVGCPLGLPEHNGDLCPLHQAEDELMAQCIDIFGRRSLADVLGGDGCGAPMCPRNRNPDAWCDGQGAGSGDEAYGT